MRAFRLFFLHIENPPIFFRLLLAFRPGAPRRYAARNKTAALFIPSSPSPSHFFPPPPVPSKKDFRRYYHLQAQLILRDFPYKQLHRARFRMQSGKRTPARFVFYTTVDRYFLLFGSDDRIMRITVTGVTRALLHYSCFAFRSGVQPARRRKSCAILDRALWSKQTYRACR